MKHLKWLPLVLAGAMSLSVMLAACGEQTGGNEQGGNNGGTQQGGQQGGGNTGTEKTTFSGGEVICYDNLPNDGISLSKADTTFAGPKGLDTSKFAVTGAASYTDIATYDSASGLFTAVGAGAIVYTAADGSYGKLTVVPAYVEDPENQYTSLEVDRPEGLSTLLGNTHDPSFIETVSKSGKSTYYLFSTGWNNNSSLDDVNTYGNAIHSSDDLVHWTFEGRTFSKDTIEDDFVNTETANWLYGDGTRCSGYGINDASWWAPDIVPCPTGGYWLYTCVVDGSEKEEGMQLSGGKYARACILLYHSDSLYQGTFKPVMKDGKPVVLMQSSILRGESVADVNGIDPQIIYTPDGRMFMAYGSFGSGNYILELDPATGMRLDGKTWQTHEEIRGYVEDIQDDYGTLTSDSIGWEHPYYGKNISKANMEAPVIARHDNVKVFDETATFDENGEPQNVTGKTYYYSMHSYDGLSDNYQMWGGRSESVLGTYTSVGGGVVRNSSSGYPASPSNKSEGNKYMGGFRWADKADGVKEYDIVLPGHNDLYTTQSGVSLAAYITRIPQPSQPSSSGAFLTQVHQYYLNSLGHIVINPNRYGLELDRAVSEEELLEYTKNDEGKGYKFKMVVMANHRDADMDNFNNIHNVSRNVYLTADHTITEENGTQLGTWEMYGRGYIKFTFTATLKGTDNADSGNKIFYGVVRPAWLGDQNKSGFTITTLGSDEGSHRSMAMFMNNYSTLTGTGLVG